MLRASRSGAMIRTRSRRALAAASRKRSSPGRRRHAPLWPSSRKTCSGANPALHRGMSKQAVELLLSGLRLDLALGRNPSVSGSLHRG
jgi:hypothetical protein